WGRARRPRAAASDKPLRTPCSEPYLDTFRLQIQALQLQQIGLTLTPQTNFTRASTTDSSYVDLLVDRAAASASAAGKAGNPGEAGNKATRPATALANDQGVIDPNIQTGAQRNGFMPATLALDSASPSSGSNAEQPTPASQPRERKNYVGGGVEYQPGQGVRVFSLYQRSSLGLLSKQDSLSIKAGGQGKALGDLNYFADFVLFNALHRRLSVQFT